jgi:hypothetical protein
MRYATKPPFEFSSHFFLIIFSIPANLDLTLMTFVNGQKCDVQQNFSFPFSSITTSLSILSHNPMFSQALVISKSRKRIRHATKVCHSFCVLASLLHHTLVIAWSLDLAYRRYWKLCNSQNVICNKRPFYFLVTSFMVESAPVAEYQEWPFQGHLKRITIGNQKTLNLQFSMSGNPN